MHLLRNGFEWVVEEIVAWCGLHPTELVLLLYSDNGSGDSLQTHFTR